MSYLGDCARCGVPVRTRGNPGYDPAGHVYDDSGAIAHRSCMVRAGLSYTKKPPWRSRWRGAASTVRPAVPGTARPGGTSPVEQLFWAAHLRLALPELAGLVAQHPAGRYRIDFALPRARTGIELDGLAAHSSTKAIAHDRKRQRDLEAAGWYIIRFGGSEVHHDADGCVRQAAALARRYQTRGAS